MLLRPGKSHSAPANGQLFQRSYPVLTSQVLSVVPLLNHGLTGAVFLFSSVLVTVTSGCSVTVVSFDFTEPSLPTLVFSVWETVRSHPTVTSDNTAADTAARTTFL